MTTALKRGWEGKPLPVIVNSRTRRNIGNVFPPPMATLDQIKSTGVSKAAEVVGCSPQSMTVELLFPEGSTTLRDLRSLTWNTVAIGYKMRLKIMRKIDSLRKPKSWLERLVSTSFRTTMPKATSRVKIMPSRYF